MSIRSLRGNRDPNHALAWTLSVVYVVVAIATSVSTTLPGHSVVAGIAGLFLLQNWIPDLAVFTGFNSPAWSISCEAFFYALFPILIVGVKMIPVNRLRQVWASLAIIVVALPLVAMSISGPVAPGWPMNEYSLWFIYVFPPVRLMEFALGIVTARLVQAGRWPTLPRWITASLLAIAFLATPLLPPQYLFGAACAVPLTLIIAGLAVRDISGQPGRFARPVAIALGEASFALYIIHFPVLLITWQMFANILRTSWAAIVFAVVYLVIAVPLSVLMYRCYERPLMRRFARPKLAAGERFSPLPGSGSSTVPR